MRGHGLSGPHGADFAGGVVAHREHKIHLWRTGSGKFIPTLAAKIFHRHACQLDLFKRLGPDAPGGMTPRAISMEEWKSLPAENRFGHDRTRGISRAQEEDV